MSFDANPRDVEQDEEEMFVFAIAEMVQRGEVSKAKLHSRAYVDHVVREQIATAERQGRLEEAKLWYKYDGDEDYVDWCKRRLAELEPTAPEGETRLANGREIRWLSIPQTSTARRVSAR